jgi:hypothetical protein
MRMGRINQRRSNKIILPYSKRPTIPKTTKEHKTIDDLTGHGTLRSYYHRFRIIDDPTCLCKKGPQTSDHLLWECEILRKQREVLKNRIKKADGNWPITNSDVATNIQNCFKYL